MGDLNLAAHGGKSLNKLKRRTKDGGITSSGTTTKKQTVNYTAT